MSLQGQIFRFPRPKKSTEGMVVPKIRDVLYGHPVVILSTTLDANGKVLVALVRHIIPFPPSNPQVTTP